MGKTTKGGKSLNPTDAFRKEQRKKELKKNKKQRAIVRENSLVHKDPTKIQDQIGKLEVLENQGKLDKRLKAKKKQLEDTFDAVLKKKQELAKINPNSTLLQSVHRQPGLPTNTTTMSIPGNVGAEGDGLGLKPGTDGGPYFMPSLPPYPVPPMGAPSFPGASGVPGGSITIPNESSEQPLPPGQESVLGTTGPSPLLPPSGLLSNLPPGSAPSSALNIPLPAGPPPGMMPPPPPPPKSKMTPNPPNPPLTLNPPLAPNPPLTPPNPTATSSNLPSTINTSTSPSSSSSDAPQSGDAPAPFSVPISSAPSPTQANTVGQQVPSLLPTPLPPARTGLIPPPPPRPGVAPPPPPPRAPPKPAVAGAPPPLTPVPTTSAPLVPPAATPTQLSTSTSSTSPSQALPLQHPISKPPPIAPTSIPEPAPVPYFTPYPPPYPTYPPGYFPPNSHPMYNPTPGVQHFPPPIHQYPPPQPLPPPTQPQPPQMKATPQIQSQPTATTSHAMGAHQQPDDDDDDDDEPYPTPSSFHIGLVPTSLRVHRINQAPRPQQAKKRKTAAQLPATSTPATNSLPTIPKLNIAPEAIGKTLLTHIDIDDAFSDFMADMKNLGAM
eukprot:Phypoly_transcript_05177.p1 GENE.Phypoly_transcript_05177~~Phypoly_transcript_05177.p1  ORF type:complete len:607 (+),score=173.17 Phypoly_transcript_05177:156-1976(+)